MAASFSVALVPLAPLVALPPRLVAAAASCACLIGGAALGVARVRAGEPRGLFDCTDHGAGVTHRGDVDLRHCVGRDRVGLGQQPALGIGARPRDLRNWL